MHRRNPPQHLALLHPDHPDAAPCDVEVTSRGLLLRRTPRPPAGASAAGAPDATLAPFVPGSAGGTAGNPLAPRNATRPPGNADGPPRNAGHADGAPGNAEGPPGNAGHADGAPGNAEGPPGNAGHADGAPGNAEGPPGNAEGSAGTEGEPGPLQAPALDLRTVALAEMAGADDDVSATAAANAAVAEATIPPAGRRPVAGRPLRIPWWAIAGLRADETRMVPGFGIQQVVEVATDAGTLSLLAPAPEVAVLLRRISRHARWWRTSRGRQVGGVLRVGALVRGTAIRRLWTLRRQPLLAPENRPVRPALVVLMGAVLLAGPIVEMAVSGGAATNVASAASQDSSTQWTGLHNSALTPPASSAPVSLPAATSTPAPAPPSLADQPPLRSHEIFGFAPYWTLDQSSGFQVGDLTTIAYFSIDVNADGTLDESGPGWQGYESQALANLITNAHAAGSRVVLTITCFDQSTLDQLTSSSTAADTLASAVLAAVQAKSLDGVNIDFEGEGSGDQAGLTALVTQMSDTMHAANPDYQVTMDTYASSAGDPNGFYDIKSLAPVVDGFFVMAYDLNLSSGPSAASPLTSSMFSNEEAAEQYTSVVPASKVILGVPYYGYTWPTTNGTMSATATGPPTTPSYAQIVAADTPVYWDPVTDTAWTSYEQGNQWYETYFEDPTSLYFEAQMAQSFDLAGLGIWALGMDGNDPQMLDALMGFAPTVKDGAAGPGSTSASGASPAATPASTSTSSTTTGSGASSTSGSSGSSSAAGSGSSGGGSSGGGSSGGGSSGGGSGSTTTTTGGSGTTTTTGGSGTTTTTGGAGSGGGGSSYYYSGIWEGQQVSLTDVPASQQQSVTTGTPTYLGTLTDFQTNDPSVSCLSSEQSLSVWQYSGSPQYDVVMAATPADCTTADLTLPSSLNQSSSTASSGDDDSTTGTTTTTGGGDPTTTTTTTTTSAADSPTSTTTAGPDDSTVAGDASDPTTDPASADQTSSGTSS